MSVATFPAPQEINQTLPGSGDVKSEPVSVSSVGAANAASAVMPTAPTEVIFNKSSSGSSGTSGGSQDLMKLLDDGTTHFMVMGYETINYNSNLKKLGGTWNKTYRGWQFEVSHRPDVVKFLESVRKGEIKPEPAVGFTKNKSYQNRNQQGQTNQGHQGQGHQSQHFHQGQQSHQDQGEHSLPTVGGSLPVYKNNGNKQMGPWHIFVPTMGMSASIKLGHTILSFPVVSVTGSQYDGYTVMVRTKDGESKLETVGRRWQVRGLVEDHSIKFS